ncbi:hypothetical protein [Tropicimonas aquimaris]|uniref:DUF3618 domain-containing protein n=1 Tax=Tropicimonas aquimaris TaxID=914152 RepID=A0ABW3IVQ0_9RHOB
MPDGSMTDIEQRVARDRAALADTLDQLSDTLAPERLKAEARQTLDRYGRDIGGQLWDATRENPAAFAMLGAGLALLLGNASRRSDAAAAEDPAQAVPPAQAMAGFDARVAAADREMRAEMTGRSDEVPRAERMRAALGSGLNRLPPAARQRVIDARIAAIRAQEAVERRARRVTRKSEALIEQQPVVAGAAAFGVGVLLAAFLPGTRQEDALLGRHRDEAMRAAHAALSRELEALQAVGRDVRGQVRDVPHLGPVAIPS